MDVADIDRDLARLEDTFRAGFISEEEHRRRVSELNERRKLALTIQALQSASIGGADASTAPAVATVSTLPSIGSQPASVSSRPAEVPPQGINSSVAPPSAAQGEARQPYFSYSIYIYKVLKQIHPDTGISNKVRYESAVSGDW